MQFVTRAVVQSEKELGSRAELFTKGKVPRTPSSLVLLLSPSLVECFSEYNRALTRLLIEVIKIAFRERQ